MFTAKKLTPTLLSRRNEKAGAGRVCCTLALLPLLTIVSACRRDGELSATLAWMDNTYNPHAEVSGASGHGRTGWYAPRNSDGQGGEYLAFGSTETLTHDGCKMTLHIEENPANRAVYGSSSYSFNLRDMNPQSIKISTYSHGGGFRCEDYDSEERQLLQMNCDHAEIVFRTRSEAPLIDEQSHTIFAELQGSDHESKGKSKGAGAFFEVDDVEYADRFAKALRHAVELCGGKPEPF